MRRLALGVAVVLVAVACHGPVSAHDWWYLDSNGYCGDNTAVIRLYQPDPGASYMEGWTGRFDNHFSPDCQPSPAPPNTIRAQVALYKSTGLCWAGPPYAFNPNSFDAYYAVSNPGIGARLCGDGYYYARVSSGLWFVPSQGWQNDPNGLNSPQDYVCYHSPCQG